MTHETTSQTDTPRHVFITICITTTWYNTPGEGTWVGYLERLESVSEEGLQGLPGGDLERAWRGPNKRILLSKCIPDIPD